MRKFNYKCVVSKNGKRYYKRVNNRWVRIKNNIGMKAEKNKRVYKNNDEEVIVDIRTTATDGEEGDMLGYKARASIRGISDEDTEFTIDNGFFMSIEVKDEYRGRGYARKMIKETINKLLKDGIITDYTELYIDTDASGGFWEYIGMRKLDDEERFAKGAERAILVKDLKKW
jgi:GNAT superfamily N-acetyltransferase